MLHYFGCLPECMTVYYVLSWCLGRQEYRVRFSGTGIADCSELKVGAGN